MDINTLVLSYVRDTLRLEIDQAFLTGSRVVPGASTPKSDYDIIVGVTEETIPVVRSHLWRLGCVQPFVRERCRRYEDGDGVDVMSTTCFYVSSPVVESTINVLLKREVQFAAWQYATTQLVKESLVDPRFADREYRVSRFKDWRQAFAAGAWASMWGGLKTGALA